MHVITMYAIHCLRNTTRHNLYLVIGSRLQVGMVDVYKWCTVLVCWAYATCVRHAVSMYRWCTLRRVVVSPLSEGCVNLHSSDVRVGMLVAIPHMWGFTCHSNKTYTASSLSIPFTANKLFSFTKRTYIYTHTCMHQTSTCTHQFRNMMRLRNKVRKCQIGVMENDYYRAVSRCELSLKCMNDLHPQHTTSTHSLSETTTAPICSSIGHPTTALVSQFTIHIYIYVWFIPVNQ